MCFDWSPGQRPFRYFKWDLTDNEGETRGMGGKIGSGGFFEGDELVSIIIMKSIVPYIWI